MLDKVIAGSALLALFPVMLAAAIAIRLTTGGPVFFQHRRVGLGGEQFGCLKFCTMVPDAEHLLQFILKTDPVARAEWTANYKFENDSRVTWVGRILRRTSIDELPQLINVLRGDMTLVGPRPVTQAELEFYGLHAAYYKSVRPGLTGLWQVSGRSDTNYPERVALDVRYIRSASLSSDLKILLQTIGIVLARRGAV
ncbi:sugar transferase [Roseovarius sp.]|uniref:sugar transferase n=1 Tax=Roseovarius sp. TaxID=1486281 RepID=UPI003D0F2CBC